MHRLALLALPSLFLFAACAAPALPSEGEKATESHFSVLPVTTESSILPALESTNGRPDVCVGLIGYDDEAERDEVLTKLEAQITGAANAWNALLADADSWSVKTEIAPSYLPQSTECKGTNDNGFSVNLWKDVQRFKDEFCAKAGMKEGSCSSAALYWKRTFNMGPWNRTVEVDALDGFTTLHEYGHLLGLGDTYKIPGANDWDGEQPDAVMNGQSYTLTEDDALGLLATVRTVETGVRSCDGLADSATLTSNSFDAVLCNPKAVPVSLHPGRPTGPDGNPDSR